MHTPSEYEHINNVVFPAALARFKAKQADYTHDDGATFLALGAKGQFADINRKFWKLKAAVWDGRSLTDEDAVEVCQDMMGHLALLIHCLETTEPEDVSDDDHDFINAQIALTPRCGQCADCVSPTPIWCLSWGRPNEYVISHCDKKQRERMERMFNA